MIARKILAQPDFIFSVSQMHRYRILSFDRVSDIRQLENSAFALLVRNTIRDYLNENGLDIVTRGMRFILEYPAGGPTRLFLGHDRLAAQNAVHWKDTARPWRPVEDDKGRFFTAVDHAALENRTAVGRVLFGDSYEELANDLIYLPVRNCMTYAVASSTPNALVHYLLLTQNKYGTYLDADVTAEEWVTLFQMAKEVIDQKGSGEGQTVRIVSNIGQNFQVARVAHAHVLIDHEFPSVMPEEYRFSVGIDGAIELNDDQAARYNQEIIGPYTAVGLEGKSQAGLHGKLSRFNS